MKRLLFTIALVATPATAQTVPTECTASMPQAIAFYRAWFEAVAKHPYYGPDIALASDAGVQAMACYIQRGAVAGPSYGDGFKAGVAAAAALAATAKQGDK